MVKERTEEISKANSLLSAEIIERQKKEVELWESSERYRALAENSFDLISEISIHGQYLYVSPNYKDVLGYEPQELIGTNITNYINPEDYNIKSFNFNPNFETALIHIIFRFKHKNGEWLWSECTKKSYRTASDEIRWVMVTRDITYRKKVEEELIKANKLESIGLLAGGIAHDFNNILNILWGNISLIKLMVNSKDDIYKRLQIIDKGFQRARELCQQLTTFAKGGAPIKKITSIVDLLKESANFTMRSTNVSFNLNFVEPLWPVEVDEGQINQVFNNLIINAIEAMPNGGKLEAKIENIIINEMNDLTLRKGKYIKITLMDTGNGIPMEILPKIFDPYFTTKQRGTGLGLTTTYSIIKKHEGNILVDSKPGYGTVFEIFLPVSEPKDKAEETKIYKQHFHKGKILIMDDEPDILDLLKNILIQFGYQVTTSKNGLEALKLYQKALKSGLTFQVVIMDLTITGGMGGKETVTKLLKIDSNAKVIVSSGYSNDPVMANYTDLGFCGVLTKPYTPEELSKVLSQVIEN